MSPTKRGSESEIKNGRESNSEIRPEDVNKLDELAKELAITELALEKRARETLEPYYIKRREVLKTIPSFWPKAFRNMAGTAVHLQHQMDLDAISYLEDLWVVRDKTEPRCFTLEFHFKSNPYFSNSVLKKEFKYLPTVKEEEPNAEGITPAMLAFDWDLNVAPQATTIQWKDQGKNLTKLYSRIKGDEDDDLPAEPGSFFNFFEHADDPFDIGAAISTELFPDAIEYFSGTAEAMEYDDSDDDEDEDEDDEIDLENPRKKQKTG
ncbi:hypothetical protein BU17DRAFT_73626 [Hysterangium stoloniferum]|nr:hypothetical protein BU17DRAFT_73626 [Hysterangium stoloniferum]